MSLAGIPPLSGFVSKFSLMAAITEEQRVVGARRDGVVVSLLTLFTMMKIWMGVFWRPVDGVAATPQRNGCGGHRR